MDQIKKCSLAGISFTLEADAYAALEGYILAPMPWYLRLASAAGGLLLIYPGTVTDVIGLALVAAVLAVQFIQKKNAKTLNA